MLRTLIAAATAALLVACGGGGGDGGGSQIGPLSKYAGTYSFCDGAEKVTMVVTVASGGNEGTLRQQSEYFAARGCTGAVVGLETYTNDLSLRYLSTGPATVTGYPASNSVATFTVDRIRASTPGGTAVVTGSGVSTAGGQTCITHGAGRTCLGSLAQSGGQLDVGFFFTDQALVTANATATGYERDLAFPRP